MATVPNLRQLQIVSNHKDGKIYLNATSHKDRTKVLASLEITDAVLTCAVQNLCHGVPRGDTHFTTVRMPSGNYRIYIREISDIEADRFHEEYRKEQEIYGDNDY